METEILTHGHGLRLSDSNKETTYLLTYLLTNLDSLSSLMAALNGAGDFRC